MASTDHLPLVPAQQDNWVKLDSVPTSEMGYRTFLRQLVEAHSAKAEQGADLSGVESLPLAFTENVGDRSILSLHKA